MLPTVSIDYFFIGPSGQEEAQGVLPMLAVKSHESRMTFVYVVERPAATIDGAVAKAHYPEELRRLKKGSNRIAVAAKLLTPWLRHEMFLYMKVTDAHWLALGTFASLKLNGENHRKYAHNMATGQWYFVLRESLISVMQTTSTLKTLGVALGDNCGDRSKGIVALDFRR